MPDGVRQPPLVGYVFGIAIRGIRCGHASMASRRGVSGERNTPLSRMVKLVRHRRGEGGVLRRIVYVFTLGRHLDRRRLRLLRRRQQDLLSLQSSKDFVGRRDLGLDSEELLLAVGREAVAHTSKDQGRKVLVD